MKSFRFDPDFAEDSGIQYRGFVECLYQAVAEIGRDGLHYCEIGCGQGETALIAGCLPQVAVVTTIDRRFTDAADQRLQAITEKLTKLKGRSEELWNEIETPDILYIDGNHNFAEVSKDLSLYGARVASDGVICGHDYCDKWPGVVAAVDEYAERYGFAVTKYRDGSWRLL